MKPGSPYHTKFGIIFRKSHFHICGEDLLKNAGYYLATSCKRLKREILMRIPLRLVTKIILLVFLFKTDFDCLKWTRN